MTTRPSPAALWRQADGDRARYRELMIEHGHLVPGKPEPLACGWPGNRVTEADVMRAMAVEAFREARRAHTAICTQDRWPVGNGDCCLAAGLAGVFAAGFRDGLTDPPGAA